MREALMIYGGVGMISGAAAYNLGTLLPMFIGLGFLLLCHGMIRWIGTL
jgi:hypothetical protein